ncbi:MAG: hypothetical protein CMM44_09895 [Rhodospirillaceae bacterium]|nr:hypothetical protein [Rhodospirillaceae bacterium]|tara:strand:- start:17 stop:553 length:537 start_codon:yes stop_codon:yes gene_type:complete
MKISDQISRLFPGCFKVLILDNEVTLDAFITEPPLRWARLINQDGQYTIPDIYPTVMTKKESDREEMNWDRVDLGLLRTNLEDLNHSVDLVAIGNNASQGLPLANSLPPTIRSDNAAVIYGTSLPEQSIYQGIGYNTFCPRDDLLRTASQRTEKEIALCFINTIEHNEQNYHAPWTPR